MQFDAQVMCGGQRFDGAPKRSVDATELIVRFGVSTVETQGHSTNAAGVQRSERLAGQQRRH